MALFSGVNYFLIIICLIFLGAMAMLISGILTKKKKLWVWGIVLLVIFILVFAVSTIVYMAIKKAFSPNEDKYPAATEAYNYQAPDAEEDSLGIVSEEVDSDLSRTFGAPFRGNFYDEYDRKYDFPVYVDAHLKNLGLVLKRFDTKKSEGTVRNVLIKFEAKKDINRKCMLIIHGPGSTILVEHVASLSMAKGEGELNLQLPAPARISDWRYCTFTLFE